jgi:hypothetical protein
VLDFKSDLKKVRDLFDELGISYEIVNNLAHLDFERTLELYFIRGEKSEEASEEWTTFKFTMEGKFLKVITDF